MEAFFFFNWDSIDHGQPWKSFILLQEPEPCPCAPHGPPPAVPRCDQLAAAWGDAQLEAQQQHILPQE